MPASSRRSFLTQTAALITASKLVSGKAALTANNLGVELYTVRNVITKDPTGVLNAIQQIGYRTVEVNYGNMDQIWSALKATPLKPVSIHLDNNAMDASRIDTVLGDLAQRGFQYVVPPSYQIAQGGADGVKRIAEQMNKTAEQAKSHGLIFAYHTHAHDFTPINGTPALHLFMDAVQKDLVFLELDIFWVSVAGHNPADVIKKYSGRVPMLHLKDKAPGVPVQFNEKVPPTAFKEVGSGTIDIAASLSAAATAGVRHYFVEQDQTPGDPIASLRQSFQYLSGHFSS